MKFKLEFHPGITTDYAEAYECYEGQRKGLGEDFFDSVRNKLDQIAEHPLLLKIQERL
jgi:hypothetical protein